ncbi:MAG: preprotein translocase subunit YajC [Deltaproteobacteria bacterium]|nr:MAG: preprotein translocase subunit YajC [Deltaproteobacteria bacterium]
MTGIAYAANGAAPGGGGIVSFIPLILIFVIFYFLLIRPQQKKAKEHQAYLANLQKGDSVVTSGGLHGEITGLTDSVVTLEIADNLRVKVSRQHILGSKAAVTADNEATAAGKKTGGGT